MVDLESLYTRAGPKCGRPTVDMASAFVSEYGEWLDDTIRRCVTSSESRDVATRKLETALANRLNRDLDEAYDCVSKVARAGMSGTFEPDRYIDFGMMADAFMEDRWPRHLGKSDLKMRGGSRTSSKKTSARKATSRRY